MATFSSFQAFGAEFERMAKEIDVRSSLFANSAFGNQMIQLNMV